MFLGLLDNQKKELFLGLAYNLARADGDYSNKEDLMIKSYCQEMQIEFSPDMIKETDKIIAALSSICGQKEKRIIVFEAIGLAMSDGEYGLAEKKVMAEMLEKFGIDYDYVKKCEDEINRYLILQHEVNKLVIG